MRAAWSSRTTRRRGSSSARSGTRVAPTRAAAGSTTSGSGSTTAGPTCRLRDRHRPAGEARPGVGAALRSGGRYAELLTGVDGVELAPADDPDHRRSWFVYVIMLAPEIDRARVMADLRERGVDVAEYVISRRTCGSSSGSAKDSVLPPRTSQAGPSAPVFPADRAGRPGIRRRIASLGAGLVATKRFDALGDRLECPGSDRRSARPRPRGSPRRGHPDRPRSASRRRRPRGQPSVR